MQPLKAIETTYHGPTNTRGARLSATDSDRNRVSISYPHDAQHQADAHLAAARALCARMGWTGTLAGGATRRGYVFVFVDESSTAPITPGDQAPATRAHQAPTLSPADLANILAALRLFMCEPPERRAAWPHFDEPGARVYSLDELDDLAERLNTTREPVTSAESQTYIDTGEKPRAFVAPGAADLASLASAGRAIRQDARSLAERAAGAATVEDFEQLADLATRIAGRANEIADTLTE